MAEPPPPYAPADDAKKPSATAPPNPMDEAGAGASPYPQIPAGTYAPPPAVNAATTTVIVQQHTSFGPQPQQLTCPQCQAQIVTQINHDAGLLVWMVAGAICIVGFSCGCCLIPFCIDDLQDVKHSCPNCKTFLGTYKRI